jgi:hypothetical protein
MDELQPADGKFAQTICAVGTDTHHILIVLPPKAHFPLVMAGVRNYCSFHEVVQIGRKQSKKVSHTSKMTGVSHPLQ